MVDVKDFLTSKNKSSTQCVTLTGWLIDKNDGLYILGEHFPENYNYEFKIKIHNFNIMHQILRFIPSLGGGQSLLFYKTKVTGNINNLGEIIVKEIFIQQNRTSDDFIQVDVSEEIVNKLYLQYGDYKFISRSDNSMNDWMES